MLKLTPISNFKDRIQILSEKSREGFYLVSDVKSKLTYKQILLEKGLIENGNNVLRATDFFSHLLLLHYPDYQVVSSEQLEFVYNTWKEKHSKEFSYSLPKSSLVFEALQFYLPILSHPSGGEVYSEWAQKQKSSLKNLEKWLLITRKFWNHLKELRMVEASCARYLLIDKGWKDLKTSITVDLGFSMDLIDASIFLGLSKDVELEILFPQPTHNLMYKDSHQAYSILDSKIHSKKQKEIQTHSVQQVHRFQNTTEEVQFVTHQIRKILDTTSLKPKDIAVVAPHIEHYWPCIKSYFNKEGLPSNKGEFVPLLSFTQIQQWLSSIRLYSGDISFHNFEHILFKKGTDYTRFQSQYFHADREQDLKNTTIQESFSHPSIQMTLDDFLDWIYHLWNPIIKQNPNKYLHSQVNNLLSEVLIPFSYQKNRKSALENWIEMLASAISKKEIRMTEDESNGITCVSINAIHSVSASYVIFIGMNHQSYQLFSSSFLNQQEADQVFKDLGFYGFHQDPSIMEYEVDHFIRYSDAKVILTYSETHFKGQALHPARLWLLENEKCESSNPKVETLWGLSQKQNSIQNIYKHIEGNSCLLPELKQLEESLLDYSQKDLVPPFKKGYIHSLSISRMKDYKTCPFIFLSKNLFKLEEPQYKDLTLNPIDKGSMFHTLFEKLISENINEENLEEKIPEILDAIQSQFSLLEESLWPLYRDELYQKALRFLEVEAEYRKNIPSLKNQKTEIKFKGYWDPKTGQVQNEGPIPLEGRIDRLDITDNKEAIIIDYKSSDNKLTHISSWAKNIEIQMPLYVQATQAGLLEKDIKRVVAAIYFIYKDFSKKGFIEKESEVSNMVKGRTQIKKDKDKINKELFLARKEIKEKVLEKILEGYFPPEPFEKDTCQKCHWRALCRAPHLM